MQLASAIEHLEDRLELFHAEDLHPMLQDPFVIVEYCDPQLGADQTTLRELHWLIFCEEEKALTLHDAFQYEFRVHWNATVTAFHGKYRRPQLWRVFHPPVRESVKRIRYNPLDSLVCERCQFERVCVVPVYWVCTCQKLGAPSWHASIGEAI